MEETLVCTVEGCTAHATEPLEVRGFVVCHVCPAHHLQITADFESGAARWVLAGGERTKVLSIAREAA